MSNLNIYLLQREVQQYDEISGFVVVAKDETEARTIANNNCADEGEIWECTDIECKNVGVSNIGNSVVLLRDMWEA